MAESTITPIDFNKVIPKETAEKFKIKGLETRQSTVIVFHKIGRIDFEKLSVKDAEALVKRKAFFIEAKKKKDDPSDSASK